LQPLHRFVSHRTQGAQWMTLWHSLFWTDITEHIELLVVFSTHGDPPTALRNYCGTRNGALQWASISLAVVVQFESSTFPKTPRKAGDVRDPYSIFTRMVLSGRFDEVVSRLGVRVPPRGPNLQPPMFQ
jgi:hypothetical protein